MGKASICCDLLRSDDVRDVGVVIWKASSPGMAFSLGETSKVGDGDLIWSAKESRYSDSCNADVQGSTMSHAISHVREDKMEHTDAEKYANYLMPHYCCSRRSVRRTSSPSWPWLCSHLERRDRTRPDTRGIHVPTSCSCHMLVASRRTVHD